MAHLPSLGALAPAGLRPNGPSVGGRPNDFLRMMLEQQPDMKLDCAICTDEIRLADFGSWTTACSGGHIFHTNCLRQAWTAGPRRCPTCREAPTPEALQETGLGGAAGGPTGPAPGGTFGGAQGFAGPAPGGMFGGAQGDLDREQAREQARGLFGAPEPLFGERAADPEQAPGGFGDDAPPYRRYNAAPRSEWPAAQGNAFGRAAPPQEPEQRVPLRYGAFGQPIYEEQGYPFNGPNPFGSRDPPSPQGPANNFHAPAPYAQPGYEQPMHEAPGAFDWHGQQPQPQPRPYGGMFGMGPAGPGGAPLLPQGNDPDAPYGRDHQGVPFAPHGYNGDGSVRKPGGLFG